MPFLVPFSATAAFPVREDRRETLGEGGIKTAADFRLVFVVIKK
jgi:hypothetical protein